MSKGPRAALHWVRQSGTVVGGRHMANHHVYSLLDEIHVTEHDYRHARLSRHASSISLQYLSTSSVKVHPSREPEADYEDEALRRQ